MILARSRSIKCVHKLITETFAREIFLTLCLLTAGDGCFYVGLGGKDTLPKQSSYEPYQCCPTKVAHGTKVAKMSPSSPMGKPPAFGKSRQSTNSKPATKPKPPTPAKSAPAKLSVKEATIKAAKAASKAPTTVVKADKPKTKRGFFGSGKYIWWW